MLNKSNDLKQLGFDSSLLGFDDEQKDGADKTALDLFLERCILIANKRLASWVKELQDKPEFKQAELLLATVSCLPFVWARAGVGPVNLSIEGMQITNSRPSEDEKKAIVKSLIAQAELAVMEFIQEKNWDVVIGND